MFNNRTIQPPDWKPPIWKREGVANSLEGLCTYAEEYARVAIEWYYTKKPAKARLSRVLRFLTIAATALGGLMPVLTWIASGTGGTATDQALRHLTMNQYGYLSLGLAAIFLALDRFSGSSTAWMRYVATAAAIETARELFRFDWARLTAALGGRTPSESELQSLIARITEFSSTVRGLVESETKAWVTEFQTNLSELEKRTEAAVQTAREQADKAQKDADTQRIREAPGAIDLTVPNATETEAGYTVLVDSEPKKSGIGASTCGILGVTPGLHELAVSGKIGGMPAYGSQVVTVKPAEATKVSLALLKAKAATHN